MTTGKAQLAKETPQTAAAAAASPRELLEAALARYLGALVRLTASLAERQQEAQRACIADAGEAIRQSQIETSLKEYDEFVAAAESAEAERIEAASPAFLQWVTRLQSAIEPAVKSAAEAYVADVQTGWHETQAECRAEYELFVVDVRKILGDVQAGALDPSSLSAIGQMLMTAAAYASMSMPSLPAVNAGPDRLV
jgi:hypothetical protein